MVHRPRGAANHRSPTPTRQPGPLPPGRGPAIALRVSKLREDAGGAPDKNLSYRDAGVDIDAGNQAVQRIRSLVASTRQPEQIGDLGGFAGLFGLPAGLSDPVMVACTDGVGTKLLVAIALDRHDTVGIDLVAMNVNDLIVTGARPLFVLDYIACARVEPAKIEAIVAGIADGCRQARCALLGGETAELPGMYAEGHYDLAASAVGIVDRPLLLGPSKVRAGDVALGLASSGLHSNGFSLARRALLDPAHGGMALGDPLPGGLGESVGEALLTPTRIYVDALARARDLEGAPLHGAAHITGGGLLENPQRALDDALALRIDLDALRPPPIFRAIAAQGVSRAEMLRTFNCGVGMILYVAPTRAAEVQAAREELGEQVIRLGEVVPRGADEEAIQLVGGADLFAAD
ncbi:MAG: phosphoribosylformylglycinamidine cyclo-ligase [Myxococcales bacterium]|nr:phosphoribosylformylglycinamidine cyclo-ligase [Myxococcales bacterium]